MPINNIDIIIPVYNALADVQHCVNSVLTNRDNFALKLIMVNDKSGEETSVYLRTLADQESCVTLIEHETNTGYSGAANTGFNASTAAYVIMLNSDTIVSKGWLQGLVRCAESDPKIGIVGAMTNAGIWQSIPFIPNSTVASTINFPLHEEVDNFAELLRTCSHSLYPTIPYIHGFCQFIKREVIDAIGIIDIENFATGMGSELDYCFRAADAGFLSAVADDTFVYHSKAKSLNEASRETSNWQTNFYNKHTLERYTESAKIVSNCPELHALRGATAFEVFRSNVSISASYARYSLCIVVDSLENDTLLDRFLPLANAMKDAQLNVHILVKEAELNETFKKYKHLSMRKEVLFGYNENEELLSQLLFYDIIICDNTHTLQSVTEIQQDYADILAIYYISKSSQDLATKPDLSEFSSLILFTDTETTAKTTISLFGKTTFSLDRLFEASQLSSGLNSVLSFFISTHAWQSQRQMGSFIMLLRDSLLYHRKTMDLVTFSKGIPPTSELFSVDELFQQLTKPLWQRRFGKLINHPHQYFSDSSNIALRPMRYLFKAKS